MEENENLHGMVTVTVYDSKGRIKRLPQRWWEKLMGLSGRLMQYSHHNTITTQGDGMIADWMTAGSIPHIDSQTGCMAVGTGWTGTSPKANVRCNNQVGEPVKLDNGYPKKQAAFGKTGQNIILYRTTFSAGTIVANGINEVTLLNGNTETANCLAYAQITPAVNLSSSDTLVVDWQITVSGS